MKHAKLYFDPLQALKRSSLTVLDPLQVRLLISASSVFHCWVAEDLEKMKLKADRHIFLAVGEAPKFIF